MKYGYVSNKVADELGIGSGGSAESLEPRVNTLEGEYTTLNSKINTINNTDLPAIDMRLDEIEEVTNVLGDTTVYSGNATGIAPNSEQEITNFVLEKGVYIIKAIARIGSGMENHSLSAALSQTKDSVFASGEYEITHTSISRASANIFRIIEVESTTQYYFNAIQTANQNKTIGYDIKILTIK